MSISSVEDALTQYADNAVYEGDVNKTAAYLSAVRYLLAHRPTQSAHGPVSLSWASLEKQEENASRHYASILPRTNRVGFTRARVTR